MSEVDKMIVAILIALVWVLMLGLIRWADVKDQAALDKWYNDPERIWNQHD